MSLKNIRIDINFIPHCPIKYQRDIDYPGPQVKKAFHEVFNVVLKHKIRESWKFQPARFFPYQEAIERNALRKIKMYIFKTATTKLKMSITSFLILFFLMESTLHPHVPFDFSWILQDEILVQNFLLKIARVQQGPAGTILVNHAFCQGFDDRSDIHFWSNSNMFGQVS